MNDFTHIKSIILAEMEKEILPGQRKGGVRAGHWMVDQLRHSHKITNETHELLHAWVNHCVTK